MLCMCNIKNESKKDRKMVKLDERTRWVRIPVLEAKEKWKRKTRKVVKNGTYAENTRINYTLCIFMKERKT